MVYLYIMKTDELYLVFLKLVEKLIKFDVITDLDLKDLIIDELPLSESMNKNNYYSLRRSFRKFLKQKDDVGKVIIYEVDHEKLNKVERISPEWKEVKIDLGGFL